MAYFTCVIVKSCGIMMSDSDWTDVSVMWLLIVAIHSFHWTLINIGITGDIWRLHTWGCEWAKVNLKYNSPLKIHQQRFPMTLTWIKILHDIRQICNAIIGFDPLRFLGLVLLQTIWFWLERRWSFASRTCCAGAVRVHAYLLIRMWSWNMVCLTRRWSRRTALFRCPLRCSFCCSFVKQTIIFRWRICEKINKIMFK